MAPPPTTVVDASSQLVLAAQAVLRAIAARSSGSPDADWTAFLEADLRGLASKDGALAEMLGGSFGWNDGQFADRPDLERLRYSLPVFIRRPEPTAGGVDDRAEFERRVTKFINKVSPRNAQQAAEEFSRSGMWCEGREREWRLYAFASLMLRSFARLARYRPAKGNMFNDSILSTQVSAVCALLECTPGLPGAIDLWVMHLLGCQPLWSSQRLTMCSVHAQLEQKSESLGLLPNFLLRRVLGFLYPETEPVLLEVARLLPPHAESTEVAIILGHLLWSCSPRLWEAWCPMSFIIIDTLLSAGPTEVHHAGIILFAACGRLSREPIEGAAAQAAALGRQLEAIAKPMVHAHGFIRHRIASAVEMAAGMDEEKRSQQT